MADNRFADALPFETQDLGTGDFHLAGRNVSAAEVVERLAPHLTDARMARISQVVGERTYSVAAVVEHLYDIGNISAVMRSTESFGFLPFHIIERPGARYKMSDRISRGTEKWLDIRKYRVESRVHQTVANAPANELTNLLTTGPGNPIAANPTADCFDSLHSMGYKIYATDLDATTTIDEIDLSQKIAIVMGNEHEGISPYAREHADGRVMLPMYGFAQSFNISVAAALTFSQVHR